MNFYNPLAFIGLISVPIIIIMYLLKQKYTEKSVSSIMFWDIAITKSQSEKPWQKLRKNLSMIIQILCAILLTIILAKPYINQTNSTSKYLIVLDSSLSMNAMDTGKQSRFETGKDKLKSIVKTSSKETEFTIIYGSNKPYIAINNATNKNEIIKTINDLKPTNGILNKKDVRNLVNTYENEEISVIFITDNENLKEKQNEAILSIGNSGENVAITNLSFGINGDVIDILIKVKNYGKTTVNNELSLYLDDKIDDTREITLLPNEEKDIYFLQKPKSLELLAKLEMEDFLTTDNIKYATITEDKIKKVYLLTDSNIFITNFINLLPNIELYEGTKENAINLTGYDLYIFDGIIPENIPTDGHLLIFNPPTNSIIKTEGETEITNISLKDDKMMQFINNLTFDIGKTKIMEKPDWATTILESEDTPLIIAGEINTQKIIVMGFDLHNTDLVLKKEFPIFMYNLFNWFLPNNTTDKQNGLVNDTITFNLNPSITEANVYTPDNAKILIAPPFPAVTLENTLQSGIYYLEQKIDNEKTYSPFPINIDNYESNIAPIDATDANISYITETGKKDISYIFILILLGFLMLEWWIYANGI